jgi:hypothetical protein
LVSQLRAQGFQRSIPIAVFVPRSKSNSFLGAALPLVILAFWCCFAAGDFGQRA